MTSRVRTGVTVVLGSFLLVPVSLVIPPLPPELPVTRVLLLAFLAGILRKVWRGELPSDVLRPRRLHFALAALLAITFANGVVLTSADNPFRLAMDGWLGLLDQLLVLVAVLAAARVLGAWTVARTLAGLAVITAFIAVWEHVTKSSYSSSVLGLIGEKGTPLARGALGQRGEDVRVRGAFEFALEYAWAAAALVPLVVAVSTRWRRRIALASAPLLILAIVWTISRSAPLGIAVGLLVLVLASGLDKRVRRLLVVGIVLAAILVATNPSLVGSYSDASVDSANSRVRRLVLVTRLAADRPYTGIGLAGLKSRGIAGTDSSPTHFYATTGVPGVVGYGVVLVAIAGTALVGLRDPKHRLIAAAALGGAAAAAVGDAATNIYFVPGASKVVWALAALGAAAADGAPVRAPRRVSVRARALLPVAGLALGVAVMFAGPVRSSATYRFSALSMTVIDRSSNDPQAVGRYFLETACGLVEHGASDAVSISCLDPRDAAGVGEVRFEASTDGELQAAVDDAASALARGVPGLRISLLEGGRSRPTWAASAPFGGALLGLALALLCPPVGRPDWRRWLTLPQATGDASPATAADPSSSESDVTSNLPLRSATPCGVARPAT
jgi:hypothetical protein